MTVRYGAVGEREGEGEGPHCMGDRVALLHSPRSLLVVLGNSAREVTSLSSAQHCTVRASLPLCSPIHSMLNTHLHRHQDTVRESASSLVRTGEYVRNDIMSWKTM